MAATFKRTALLFALCSLFGLFLAPGCSGSGDDNGGNGSGGGGDVSTDAGGDVADTGEPDTSDVECTEDSECGEYGACENNECIGASCEKDGDCGGDRPGCSNKSGRCVECTKVAHCDQGEKCANNTCTPAECTEPRESCNPDNKPGKGFKCIDNGTGPKCMTICEDTGSCPADQICLPAGEEETDTSVCYFSQCEGPADASACDGISSQPYFGDYGNPKARCGDIGITNCGSATMCLPSGTKKTGESCTVSTPLRCQSDNCQICNRNNVCQAGKCRKICTGDGECSSGTCIGENDDNVVGQGAGFCGEECDAFTQGQCSSAGDSCKPLNNEIGFCRSGGDKGFMEQCTPPSPGSPGNHACKDGMDCIVFAQTQFQVIGRCLPRCSPSGRQDNNPTDNHATCGGTYYGRFAHLAESPSTLDVYLEGSRVIDDLAAGDVASGQSESSFFSQDVNALFGKDSNAGKLEVAVAEGSSSGPGMADITSTTNVLGGRVETWVVHESATSGGNAVTRLPVPRRVQVPAAGNAKVRAAHLANGLEDGQGNPVQVDIVAAPTSGGLSNGVELGTNLSRGTAGEFTSLSNGSYDIFIFKTGANRSAGNEIAKLSGVQFSETQVTTLVLHSSASDLQGDKLAYASAPKAPRMECLSFGSTAPASGVCLNACRTSDYGSDWCSEGDGCTDLGGRSFCFPEGDSQVGDSCNPSSLVGCTEGATCVSDGTGSGKCRSHCIGGGSSNSALQCGSNTSCEAAEGNFGTCGVSCSPNNNQAGPNCPSNLKACIPQSTQQSKAFCSASGSKSKGDKCGGGVDVGAALLQNCNPGAVCAHKSGGDASFNAALVGPYSQKDKFPTGVCRFAAQDPGVTLEQPTPQCRQLCDPFADNPCPDGQACGLDVLHGTGEVGVCLEKVPSDDLQDTTPATGNSCGAENVGQMCGQRSHCIPSQGNGICYQYCDWESKQGCAGDTECRLPSGQLLFGRYGICLPPDTN